MDALATVHMGACNFPYLVLHREAREFSIEHAAVCVMCCMDLRFLVCLTASVHVCVCVCPDPQWATKEHMAVWVMSFSPALAVCWSKLQWRKTISAAVLQSLADLEDAGRTLPLSSPALLLPTFVT